MKFSGTEDLSFLFSPLSPVKGCAMLWKRPRESKERKLSEPQKLQKKDMNASLTLLMNELPSSFFIFQDIKMP